MRVELKKNPFDILKLLCCDKLMKRNKYEINQDNRLLYSECIDHLPHDFMTH